MSTIFTPLSKGTIKVLIIDEVASMRKFAKFGLEKSFPLIVVEEAASGKEAQMKLEHSEYDLILCDWEVPDITGDEVLHWVRRHPNLSATPFIMVTSRNDRPSVLKAIESGANAYVVKPYTAELLAQKITAVIDKFDRRQYERYTATGAITVHFHELVARGKLIDMSRGGLFSSFSRKNPLPSIFERVLIDIKLKDVQKTRGGDQPPSQLTEKTESLLLTFKKPGRTTPPSPPVPGMA